MQLSAQMANTIPLVEALRKFDEAGFLQDVVTLHNIAFRLAMDVVRFYGQSTTTKMAYGEESKYWWRTGWHLFGEKFLRFHSVRKHLENLLDKHSSRGSFSPDG